MTEELEKLLKIKIERPFGIFLSGGLDSGILAALLKPDIAITCTYDIGEKYNELEYAKKICRHLGIKQYIVRPQRKNSRLDFEYAIEIIGKPTNSISISSWFYSMIEAKRLGFNRMVGGEGADELFGGYTRYIILNAISQLYRAPQLKNYKSTLDMLFGSVGHIHSKLIGEPTPSCPIETPISAIGKWEYENTLPDIVHMENKLAKHFGIELYLPFMSKRVKSFAINLPEEMKINGVITKPLIREIAKKYLPEEVVNRTSKMGFVSPILKWLGFDKNGEFNKKQFLEYQKQICTNQIQKQNQKT